MCYKKLKGNIKCKEMSTRNIAKVKGKVVGLYGHMGQDVSHVITRTLYSLRFITRFPQLSLLFLTLRTYVFSIHVCLRIITYIFPSMSLYI